MQVGKRNRDVQVKYTLFPLCSWMLAPITQAQDAA